MTAINKLPHLNAAIRIGGASGYWGDAAIATKQLLGDGNLDYIVYDYLAEITMSIMARAISRDPEAGFATDFISSAMKPNIDEIASQGVKIISNAGGINPTSCSRALEKLILESGHKLKVACITGDNLLEQSHELSQQNLKDMYYGESFPDPQLIGSINAYIGAFAIAHALDMGADIVIVGRCVDSAVTLGPCIHHFGWKPDMYDLLAAGSLAGHIIECGTQATGGNFTDWHLVANEMDSLGYPIAEIDHRGQIIITKPDDTAGLVSVGTVCEQIVYEIDDPQNYQLPDVSCNFSNVVFDQVACNRVGVSGAKGNEPPSHLKTVVTWHDGFRGGQVLTFYGFDAAMKAEYFAQAIFRRAEKLLEEYDLAPFMTTDFEILGNESQYGKQAKAANAREVCVKIAACHEVSDGISLLIREITGMALSGPPGLSGFAGTRPRPSPVMKLFCCLLPRESVPLSVHYDNTSEIISHSSVTDNREISEYRNEMPPPSAPIMDGKSIPVKLVKLAWGRSGDKGDKANIGIIARDKKYLPYIWQQLDEDAMANRFEHFLQGNVERYYMPGPGAINYVMDQVLEGGGTASLRNDPQGKGYAQLALEIMIELPVEMAAELL